MSENHSALFHLDSVYKVLSFISALYDKALDFEYLESRKALWQECLYSVVSSIEGFYEVWEVANREIVYGVPAEPLPLSLRWLEKSSVRVNLIWSRVGPWTAVSRLPKLILKAESYSLESLRRLAEHYPCDAPELCPVMDQHLNRIEKLNSLVELFLRDRRRLEQLPKNLFV